MGGYPSKLLPWDKQSIIYQIITGKLDNAVQAASFINSKHPSQPSLYPNSQECTQGGWTLLYYQEEIPSYQEMPLRGSPQICQPWNWTVEDWKRVLWSDETKINRVGSDGRTYTWKQRVYIGISMGYPWVILTWPAPTPAPTCTYNLPGYLFKMSLGTFKLDKNWVSYA